MSIYPPARTSRVLAITLAIYACLAGVVGADEYAAQRERFVTAERALEAGRLDEFDRLRESLRGYPLYPYLELADLNRRFNTRTDVQIAEFLSEFDGQPVSWRLRGRWLRRLAAQQKWSLFAAHFRTTRSTDLRCLAVTALLNIGDEAAAFDLVERLWLHGKSQPDECDHGFKVWREAGELSPDRVWARIELAMDAGQTGLARYLKRFLPEQERPAVDQWLRLAQRAAAVVEAGTGQTTDERLHGIRVWALLKLATTEPERAPGALSKLRDANVVDETDAARVAERIALSFAYRHDERANAWFARVRSSQLSERGQDWRILSALRAGLWQVAHDAITDLPESKRQDERWRYWLARALAALGRTPEATNLLSGLSRERNYYGFLASDILEQPYALNEQPLAFSNDELSDIARHPGVLRAREFFRLKRWVEARREWVEVAKSVELPIERAKLAWIAHQWRWHDRAILTVASTPYLDDLVLRFPTPYMDFVSHEAKHNQLDSAWIFALVRQESAFIPDARSSTGALGLMQIMPATGRYIAQKTGHEGFRTNALLAPQLNVRFGTWYLHQLWRSNGNHPVLATAAYNAGPRRVRRWLPDSDSMAADIWIDTIPFTETRKYVRRVMTYMAIYQHNLGRPIERLTSRLDPIQPR